MAEATFAAGAEIHVLSARSDPRGSLVEVWRQSRIPIRPAQLTVTHSQQGVLRGMHLHKRQTDVWHVASGRGLLASMDLRQRPFSVAVTEIDQRHVIVIPPRVAHGLYALEPLTLIYLLDAEYDGTDEYGFRWDDPDASIPWQVIGPLLSERDRDALPLHELLRGIE